MNRKHILALVGAGVFAVPMTAQAQTAGSTVTLTANVDQACVLGQPSATELQLGDLTGPDGRLASTLTSAAVSVSTEIPVAWCNGPSKLTVNAEPLGLVPADTPAYNTPAGFSRLITYNATLIGWPSNLTDRPYVGDSAKSLDASEARAAPNPGLIVQVSSLQALNGAGTTEDANLVIEAGRYTASIVISLAVN